MLIKKTCSLLSKRPTRTSASVVLGMILGKVDCDQSVQRAKTDDLDKYIRKGL